MEDSRSSTSGSASSSTGKASATPDRYEQGDRVIIVGRDSGGEKTYRTATVVAVSENGSPGHARVLLAVCRFTNPFLSQPWRFVRSLLLPFIVYSRAS